MEVWLVQNSSCCPLNFSAVQYSHQLMLPISFPGSAMEHASDKPELFLKTPLTGFHSSTHRLCKAFLRQHNYLKCLHLTLSPSVVVKKYQQLKIKHRNCTAEQQKGPNINVDGGSVGKERGEETIQRNIPKDS